MKFLLKENKGIFNRRLQQYWNPLLYQKNFKAKNVGTLFAGDSPFSPCWWTINFRWLLGHVQILTARNYGTQEVRWEGEPPERRGDSDANGCHPEHCRCELTELQQLINLPLTFRPLYAETKYAPSTFCYFLMQLHLSTASHQSPVLPDIFSCATSSHW